MNKGSLKDIFFYCSMNRNIHFDFIGINDFIELT